MGAFDTPAMAALRDRLVEPPPQPERPKPMSNTPRRPERRDRDGRDIAIDRRAVGMVVVKKDDPDTSCVVGLRLAAAKPVPLQATYADVLAWWVGADKAAGNSAR